MTQTWGVDYHLRVWPSPPSTGIVATGPGGSGSYYQTTSGMSRTVDVYGGSKPWEVAWKLECDGVPAGNGTGTDGTVHVISSSGLCTLTMLSLIHI